MTNKKLKMAAMSVALTACVAASPLAANADAPEAAPEKKEPAAEETKKEENTAEPQVNNQDEKAQETLKDAEVKYDKEHPKPNPDGSETLDGVIVTKPEEKEPEGGETGSGETGSETGGETGGETNPNPDSGETDTKPEGSGETGGETGSGETAPEEKKPEEKVPEEKEPEKVEIGTAEKTEKSETTVETKPDPGAEPIVDTTTPPTVEKNPDGSTTITQPTVTPGTETTTTTGSGEAKGDLHEKKEEVEKKDINLKEELGEKPDISWEIQPGDEAVAGKGYKVEEVTNSEDGNRQTLKLKKEEETTAEMTAEDIAKLVDAEKPTVNPDGTYTLTRTETILDAEGNPQTRTTYITIQNNKVTTKTTTELTITREKEKQEGNERVDFEVKYPEITVTNKEKPEDTQTISPDLLDTILSQNPKEDGSYEYTDGDGQKYEVKVDETAKELNNAEIVARLKQDGHTEYTLGADGEIYYTTPHNETVKLDVTQNQLLRRSLTYKVTLTTTEKGSVENESKKPEEESKAKMNAIRDALNNAVGEMGVEDPVKAKLTSAIANATLDPNGGTFKEEIDGKTYTLTYTGADVRIETKDATNPDVSGKDPENITDVKDNTVTGTAYVTGSTITYQDGAEYKTTGAGELGIGADFTTAPEGAVPDSIQRDKAGRITSYKDAQGNTHSFEYTSVDLNALTPEERAKLEAAAKKDGWNTENLTASLTRVNWKVESPRTEIQQTEPIESDPIELVKDNNWSQTDHGDTVDFTHGNKTYAGMTLDNTSEDGKTKTYKKTEANGTVTIITVTTQQLDIKAKFDEKFGEGNYEMNATEHTVTYKKDGKTYKASYVDLEEKLTVEVQKPQEVAATGSTEAEAKAAFLKQLEEARQKAENAGEILVIEYKENGEIKYLTVTEKTTWEEISKVVGKVVNYNAMTDAELVEYLKKLETTAKKDGKYYDGSTKGDTPYYRDADGKIQRVPQGVNVQTGWKTDWFGIPHKYSYVKIDGKEHEVRYGNNDIDHLDLATDSKLTLSEKEKDGTAKTDDCVLLNPKLTWSENAGQLVAGKGEQAKLSNRITYDNEGDNDPNTGHHEYPRASWDNPFAKDNAPTKSVFYKVEGQVAYGKLGNDYTSEKRARADLQAYKDAHPDLDLSKAQVVKVYKNQTSYSSYYYQIYLYQSDLAAYGYMSDDNNTCGNALFNAEGDLFNAPQSYYVGGYDLTLGNLTQTDKNHVVAMGKNTTALSATFKRRKLETLTNRELRYTPNSVTETIIHESEVTGQGTDLSGSYRADYTKTADYTDEQQKGIEGTGTGSYKSFTNLIRNIFNGEGTGTVEGGFIKYEYHTEKTKDGTPVQFEADQMVVTTKQDAEVHYTFTSQESRDVWIKGYTQTVVPPVTPGPDAPELPPVEDAKPAPAPEAPVLPVVQDARPDPAPAPVSAPAPETPVLPAVQDARLIQTGTSSWLADLMLGAGTVLSAAGYWMERKRKAMSYKSKH